MNPWTSPDTKPPIPFVTLTSVFFHAGRSGMIPLSFRESMYDGPGSQILCPSLSSID